MSTGRPSGVPDRDPGAVLVNRYVVAAFLVQLLGYAVLVGWFDHGSVTPPVALVRGLPDVAAPFLALLAALAIPAALVSVAVVGAGEFLLGRPPSLGVGLVTRGDLPFLVAAYLFAVAVGHVATEARRPDEAPEVEQ